MANKKKRVVEQLLDQCRQAYQAKKPLILVDTEEIELMERLSQQIAAEKMIDLFSVQKTQLENRFLKYYQYLADQPDTLERSENFSYDSRILEDLVEKGWNIKAQLLPQLVVLHLTPDLEGGLLEDRLRRYVHSYVRSYMGFLDNSSALRSSCVLLYGDPGLLPKDLLPYTEVLGVAYPKEWEIQEILLRVAKENGQELEPEIAQDLAKQMVGFSVIRVEEYIRRLLWADGVDGKHLLYDPKNREEIILDAKAQAIRSTGGLLTLYREKKNQPQSNAQRDLGGMETYKKWADAAGIHVRSASDFSMARGVPTMKGVLLCGVPGCGKSEAAKILHRQWGLPMLRMDVDQLMGGLVGDSERNMRQSLALAEAMAPCILWIDEIDKGFSGAVSGSGDGGTFKRMFGRLLTWMQENKKPCFIFATANDISQLPPEFFRSGRFDALFSVFLPTNDECREIFAAQMRRADKLRADTAEEKGLPAPKPLFDQECFTEASLQAIMDLVMQGKDSKTGENVKFLSGADIEKIVQNALKEDILAPIMEKLRQTGSKGLMNAVSHDESKKHLQEALRDADLHTPIGADTWLKALDQVIHDPAITTQGSGYANMDEIAACYARLLRKNFVSVSQDSQILFRKDHYSCTMKDGCITVAYTDSCHSTREYDKALFNSLRGRIEKIASGIEDCALHRLY